MKLWIDPLNKADNVVLVNHFFCPPFPQAASEGGGERKYVIFTGLLPLCPKSSDQDCSSSMEFLCQQVRLPLLRSAHTRGIVLATSRWDESHCVNWSILLQNLKGPTLVPATSPRNSNQFEFLGEVPTICSSKRFVWTVPGTSPLRPVPSCKLVRGLVAGISAGTSPLVCADLYLF